ncbi:MAG: hypothetical protein F6J93_20515 [Oscillatoria sp. SIO1A7]|nr:hypothetical protein [Oscillatoria sp. SIO1A7]
MPLSNAPTHLKELAQQGKPEGITGVLNHYLEPQGVSAQAAVKNGSLLILLESEEVPHQETIVPFIHAGLVSLGIESTPTAKIGGRQKGGRTVWQETVDLENPPEEIAIAAEGMPEENYDLPEEDSQMPYEEDDRIPEDLDDSEDSEDYESEDTDDDEDEDDEDDDDEDDEDEQGQKNKKQKSSLMLLLLLLLLIGAGVILFVVPGPLRGLLPFLSEETPNPPPTAGSTPKPAPKPAAPANAPNAAAPASAPNGASPAAPANAPNAAAPANAPNGENPAAPANAANGENPAAPANAANGENPAAPANAANGENPAAPANAANGANPAAPANAANGANPAAPANAPNGENPAAPANAPNAAAPEAAPEATEASVQLIGAVRKANEAWELTQKTPQSEQEWKEIAALWEEGSKLMEEVPSSDPKYEIAQNRIVLYQKYAEFAREMADLTSQ